MLTKRQKLFAALLGSALLHALVLFAAGLMMALQPPAAPSAEPEPLHIEVVANETPTPPPEAPPSVEATPLPTPEHLVLDNSAMKEAEKAPDKPVFEGQQNTVAASEGPATGDKPLPTQQGRQSPSYAFDTSPPQPPEPPETPPAPSAPPEPPATAPAPPAPVRDLVATIRLDGEEPAPTRVRNETAMLDKQPTPPPEELNPYDPSFRSTAPPPPVPVRPSRQTSAYKPMELQTASNGNITNRGASGVDAAATPYARYQKALLDSIRAVWTQAVNARSDFASLGMVKVHFAVDRSGRVLTPRIISNSSNEALASITLDALNHAPVPPIPPDVVASMNESMLQLDVTFECL